MWPAAPVWWLLKRQPSLARQRTSPASIQAKVCWRSPDPSWRRTSYSVGLNNCPCLTTPSTFSPWATRCAMSRAQVCWEYFKLIDRLLGETVALYGDEATILICSDHGFTGTWEVLYINTWLEQQGYLAWAPEAQQVEEGCQELQGAYHDRQGFIWDQTKAYAVTPSSTG